MSDRDEFFHVMGANGVPFKVALEFARLAGRLQRLAEVECGRTLTASEEKAHKFAIEALRSHARVNGLEFYYQSDPRGACVKLKLPGGQHNDFGGEGLWCVPAWSAEEELGHHAHKLLRALEAHVEADAKRTGASVNEVCPCHGQEIREAKEAFQRLGA